MSSQYSESSQQSDMNALVLQNKDMMQLMSLANLDLKLNKTSLLKINISDAISTNSINPVYNFKASLMNILIKWR